MTEHISIPEARKQLREWANEFNMPQLAELAEKMVRRSTKYPRAQAKRGSLTPELAARIREYKQKNPTMSNRTIGAKFNVDGGRVSEAIHHVKENGRYDDLA